MGVGRKSAWDLKIKPRLDEIRAWCREGYTDVQMAEALGINTSTFYKYKAEKTEFSEAISINKDVANLRVENSLYKRAIGCEVVEIIEDTEYIIDKNGNAKPTGRVKRRKIKKQIPPDPRAAQFLLQNRLPEKWKNVNSIEVTGKDGGPVEAATLSKKQYAKIREQMLKNDDC